MLLQQKFIAKVSHTMQERDASCNIYSAITEVMNDFLRQRKQFASLTKTAVSIV